MIAISASLRWKHGHSRVMRPSGCRPLLKKMCAMALVKMVRLTIYDRCYRHRDYCDGILQYEREILSQP